MSVKPVSPSEALDLKISTTPDFVFEAWNKMIVSNLKEKRSKFYQKDLVGEILVLADDSSIKRSDVFQHGWLDMEPVFRQLGWHVVYTKPSFHEQFEPFFEFTSPE